MSKEKTITLFIVLVGVFIFIFLMAVPRYRLFLEEQELKQARIEMEKAKIIHKGVKESPEYLEYLKAKK